MFKDLPKGPASLIALSCGDGSPGITNRSRSGVGLRAACKLAVKTPAERPAIDQAQFCPAGQEREIRHGACAADREARAVRQGLEYGGEGRVANVVMGPRRALGQDQQREIRQDHRLVEARPQFRARAVRIARSICERETAAVRVRFGMTRRMDTLGLDRPIRRDAADPCGEAPAALKPPAETPGVEFRGQGVAGEGRPVGL